MEYIKAVIKCEIKVMDPPLKSVRGCRGTKWGTARPCGLNSLHLHQRGKNLSGGRTGTKKNLRLDKKG